MHIKIKILILILIKTITKRQIENLLTTIGK